MELALVEVVAHFEARLELSMSSETSVNIRERNSQQEVANLVIRSFARFSPMVDVRQLLMPVTAASSAHKQGTSCSLRCAVSTTDLNQRERAAQWPPRLPWHLHRAEVVSRDGENSPCSFAWCVPRRVLRALLELRGFGICRVTEDTSQGLEFSVTLPVAVELEAFSWSSGSRKDGDCSGHHQRRQGVGMHYSVIVRYSANGGWCTRAEAKQDEKKPAVCAWFTVLRRGLVLGTRRRSCPREGESKRFSVKC